MIQDALYDAEEYLRAEIGANPAKSEADMLEIIASTYGAPDEVAAAYRDTEAKVKAAMKAPVGHGGNIRLNPPWLDLWAFPFTLCGGVLLLTVLLHVARGVGRLHALFAKSLLVAPA